MECSFPNKSLEIWDLHVGTQMLTSLGEIWAKAPVVTDVVEDNNRCVEAAWCLQNLVSGGGEMECSLPGKGLESWAI